jgi:hypothetical protein
MDTTDAFLALSPDGFGSFISTSPPPSISAYDFAFAQLLESPNTPNLSLAFPQASHEYPPLMSPELMQLFGASDIITRAPAHFMISQDVISHPITLNFPPELLAQIPVQQFAIIANPHLDIKGEPADAPWLSYMDQVLSHPLPFQSSLATISPRDTQCAQPAPVQSVSYSPQEIKQEIPTPQSSALQKLHQRLLQRLRKSQQDGPATIGEQEQSVIEGELLEPTQVVVSESSKKADSSFNKVLELFSYYFNTQKTASPLACTAALYLHFSFLFVVVLSRLCGVFRSIRCMTVGEINGKMQKKSRVQISVFP